MIRDPEITDLAELLALVAEPVLAAARACRARARGHQQRVWIRPAPAYASAAAASLLRGEASFDLSPAPCPERSAASDLSEATPWPDLRQLCPGDRLLVRVEHEQFPAYCAWLLRAAAAPTDWALAPHCPQPGGLLRLRLIAAARLALPAAVRVEVRHDLHGVRLAQVALGFGADTLAGPIDIGRHLPLAGVPRPSETSQAALAELVRQAGLEPVTHQPIERTAS